MLEFLIHDRGGIIIIFLNSGFSCQNSVMVVSESVNKLIAIVTIFSALVVRERERCDGREATNCKKEQGKHNFRATACDMLCREGLSTKDL
jgi:hypothetical protein